MALGAKMAVVSAACLPSASDYTCVAPCQSPLALFYLSFSLKLAHLVSLARPGGAHLDKHSASSDLTY